MSYYERDSEKSIGLKPIVLGLSLATLVGFGFLYYSAGRVPNDESSAITGASAPVTPAQVAPVSKAVSSHTHA